MTTSTTTPITHSSSSLVSNILFDGQNNETVLLTDQIEADGRFVLYQSVATNSCVLWLSCSVFTETLIVAGVRKLNGGSPTVPKNLSSSRLSVHSIPHLIQEQLLLSMDDKSKTESSSTAVVVDDEGALVVEQLYKLVDEWRINNETTSQQQQRLLILDDVTSLATLLGPTATYTLLLSLRRQSLETQNSPPFSILMRCSSDKDEQQEFFGAASSSSSSNDLFVESLVELADRIIDVTPLSSGYSREAHGRLIVTDDSSSCIFTHYNYVLTDQQVRVMRVQV